MQCLPMQFWSRLVIYEMQLCDCPTIHRSFMLLISWSFCCHSCRGNQSAPWCPSLVHLDGSLWRRDISLLVQHRAQAICINRVQKQKLFRTKNSLTFDINVSEKLLFLNYKPNKIMLLSIFHTVHWMQSLYQVHGQRICSKLYSPW